MGTLGIVLLVAFIIVSVLLILLVIIQDDGENGMGGLLGGRGTAAFGSHSASVLTKATGVLAFLFFALAISLAVVNKKGTTQSIIQDVEKSGEVEATEDGTKVDEGWWKNDESSAATETTESSDASNLELPAIDLSSLTVPETALPSGE